MLKLKALLIIICQEAQAGIPENIMKEIHNLKLWIIIYDEKYC